MDGLNMFGKLLFLLLIPNFILGRTTKVFKHLKSKCVMHNKYLLK